MFSTKQKGFLFDLRKKKSNRLHKNRIKTIKNNTNPKLKDNNIKVSNKCLDKWNIYKKGKYGNKADFKANNYLFSEINKKKVNTLQSNILIAGVNKGQSVLNIIEKYPSITIHGFEIQKKEFLIATKNVEKYPNIIIHNIGWGEVEENNLRIGGKNGTAGIYDPKGQRGWKLQNEYTSTVRLDKWTTDNNISNITYILIDTEGYEPKIIRGMGLEKIENRKKFPFFQYELGGTWAEKDNRHNNDKWSQFETAKNLEKYGYKLFMIGEENWLEVTSNFFKISNENIALKDEGYGKFIQGNLLVLHPEFTPEYIKSIIYNRKI